MSQAFRVGSSSHIAMQRVWTAAALFAAAKHTVSMAMSTALGQDVWECKMQVTAQYTAVPSNVAFTGVGNGMLTQLRSVGHKIPCPLPSELHMHRTR